MKLQLVLGLLPLLVAFLGQREAPRLGQMSENWDRTVSFETAHFRTPSSLEELRQVVRESERVKVIGAGHSWNAVAQPHPSADAVYLNLDSMPPLFEVDVEAGTVRAAAGMRLYQLTAALEEHDPPLALAALPSVRDQSLGGLVATATHSTGAGYPNLASLVVAATLVTADGSVLEVSESSELLPAVRVAMGALGVMTEVTLRVVPNFKLQQTDTNLPLPYILDNLEDLSRSSDHVKFWLFPHAGNGVVIAKERVDADLPNVEPRPRFVNEVLTYPALGLQWLGAVLPGLAPTINRALVDYNFPNKTRTARNEDVFNVPFRITRHAETEYAVPSQQCAALVQGLLQFVEEEALTINHIVEVRFVAPDTAEAWLSPDPVQEGVDTWCHVTLLMAWAELQPAKLERYFGKIREDALRMGGRPHWAKSIDVGSETLKPLFPHWDEWHAVRESVDPTGKFSNAFLQQVLGVPSPA